MGVLGISDEHLIDKPFITSTKKGGSHPRNHGRFESLAHPQARERTDSRISGPKPPTDCRSTETPDVIVSDKPFITGHRSLFQPARRIPSDYFKPRKRFPYLKLNLDLLRLI